MERRRVGVSFPKIGAEFGITQGYVYKLYKKALKEIIREPVEQLVKLELQKLDELEQEIRKILYANTPLVSSGGVVRDTVEDQAGRLVLDENGNPVTVKLKDLGPKLQAIDRFLKLMERRARLQGLDKPIKTAMTNPNGDKEPTWVQFYLPSNGRESNNAGAE